MVVSANVSAVSLRGTHCFLSVTCSLSPSDKEVEVCNAKKKSSTQSFVMLDYLSQVSQCIIKHYKFSDVKNLSFVLSLGNFCSLLFFVSHFAGRVSASGAGL